MAIGFCSIYLQLIKNNFFFNSRRRIRYYIREYGDTTATSDTESSSNNRFTY